MSDDDMLRLWRRLTLRQREMMATEGRLHQMESYPFFIRTGQALAALGLRVGGRPGLTERGYELVRWAAAAGFLVPCDGRYVIVADPPPMPARPPVRQRVLELGDLGLSGVQIGREVGVSRERVRQILASRQPPALPGCVI